MLRSYNKHSNTALQSDGPVSQSEKGEKRKEEKKHMETEIRNCTVMAVKSVTTQQRMVA